MKFQSLVYFAHFYFLFFWYSEASIVPNFRVLLFKRKFVTLTNQDLDEIESFLKKQSRCYPFFLSNAVQRNEYEIVKLLLSYNYKCSIKRNAISLAISNNNKKMFNLLTSYKVPFACDRLNDRDKALENHYFDIDDAVMRNDKVRLEYMIENVCPFTENTLSHPANKGNIEMMAYLRNHNCPWGVNLLKAAKSGDEGVLNWLKNNHCPLSQYNVSDAIELRDLKKATWMMENGCVTEKSIFDFVRTGDSFVMKWLSDRLGHKIQNYKNQSRQTNLYYSPYFNAIYRRNEERVNWLKKISFPVDGLSLLLLVKRRDIKTIHFLCDYDEEKRSQSCTLRPSLLDMAFHYLYIDIIIWLLENNCPLGENITVKLEDFFIDVLHSNGSLKEYINGFRNRIAKKNNSYVVKQDDLNDVLEIVKLLKMSGRFE